MTHALPLGLAARRTPRLLGVLGALAIGTAAGAQPARPTTQRGDSVPRGDSAQRADSVRGGSRAGAPTQGTAPRPVPLGGLSGGVLKQGGATAAGGGSRPR